MDKEKSCCKLKKEEPVTENASITTPKWAIYPPYLGLLDKSSLINAIGKISLFLFDRTIVPVAHSLRIPVRTNVHVEKEIRAAILFIPRIIQIIRVTMLIINGAINPCIIAKIKLVLKINEVFIRIHINFNQFYINFKPMAIKEVLVYLY